MSEAADQMHPLESHVADTARRDADVWAPGESLLAYCALALPEYLLRQRWYPAKDAGPPEVRLIAHSPVTLGQLPCAIAIWEARPPGRQPLRLFLPLALFPEDQLAESHPAAIGRAPAYAGVLGDALAADVFVQALVGCIQQTVVLPGVQAMRTAQYDPAQFADAQDLRVGRSAVEQSNTSLRIGRGAILKVIRKLEEGVHPELEMGRFLTQRARFLATPPLLGWIEAAHSTLAILQSFVPNDGDGWSWVQEQLRGDSAEHRAGAVRWVRRLGVLTAEMHRALAFEGGDTAADPAFVPETVGASQWSRWTGGILSTAQTVTDGLHRNRDQLDPAARRLADSFAARCAGLPDSLARLLPATAVMTRHHGDYHLGQVLVRGEDAVIVDFEGEPLRPLAERRAKQVPLRDVAGMLRSFSYAAAVAERNLPAALPMPEREARAQRLRGWAEEASGAFLDGYFATPAGPGRPADREQALRLLRYFTIEKALYETAYELANRPDWLSIPLRGVVSLLDPEPTGLRRRAHRLPFGAEVLPGGGVRFRLWAPRFERLHLALEAGTNGAEPQVLPMLAAADGWHELVVPGAGAGTRYQFVLPDGMRVPDPASRHQPLDVHGPSEVIDPEGYAWHDGAWPGRPWHEAVLYELHVGTFTPAGTFRAAIERLDYLAALGVTALEIMPVADFPGRRNWGYDGVLPYAPDSTYGRPEDFKALIDAAHARGIMVLLDVVYNHFGPDGNYLPLYAPAVFTDRHRTPWGAAVNFDGPQSAPVREFIIHNALYWIEEFNLDGLRLDAVHAVLDDGPTHVLDELAGRVRRAGRAHLVLENEENQVSRLARSPDGKPLYYTAQWNDDLHHVLHVAATGEDTGYYRDYRGDTRKLGCALAEGFAFQGQMMEFRGSARGEPSGVLPPTAFVSFIQNHDQIGNRAFGERIGALASPEAVRAIIGVYLLLPQVPMLFMGEEWGASQPFPFFCDFSGELAEAVRRGRREEFAKFPEFQDEASRRRIPDPQADETFASAKLAWADLDEPAHAAWHAYYSTLLSVRRETIVPLLPGIAGSAGRFEAIGAGAVIVRWLAADATLTLACNLSARPVAGFPPVAGRVLWQAGGGIADGVAGPWTVLWSLGAESA